jgi:pimeloyl-ACP methyl ester carboxylesterase
MKYRTKYGDIFYNIEGEGSPLLMIHGTPFSSQEWNPVKSQLKDKYKIYTYDLLGYGKSEKAENVSLGIQNKVLCDLLEFWDLEAPAVVAHDFGGATLLRSIVLDDMCFNRMMLIDVVALSPWGSPFVRHVKNYEDVFNRIPDYIHKAIVQAYIKDAVYTDVNDQEIQFLVEPWVTGDGKKAFYRQIAQMDEKYTDEIKAGLSKINIETRILWGEKDNWIPVEIGRKLHSILPNSSFSIVPDSNHLVHIDNPGIIVEEIERFFPVESI